MLVHKQVLDRFVLLAIGILALAIFSAPIVNALETSTDNTTYATYLPLAVSPNLTPSQRGLVQVNSFRANAGVPPVSQDGTLNENCFEHARYMAVNNDLTHEQDPSLPYASAAGQKCAQNGNAWLGSSYGRDFWKPIDSIEGWVSSVGHRLWLLYPTTRTFGYGFFTAENNSAGAALDVLTYADFARDEAYTGWPVRYPGLNEKDIPHGKFPITLNWRYFGPEPTIQSTSLTVDGQRFPHEAGVGLPAGHKGIEILPTADLPQNATVVVSVSGTYEGVPFEYTWQFRTTAEYNPYP